MNKITEKKWYPWLVVVLLSGVAFLNYMDRQMLSTMRFAMAEDIIEVATSYTGPWGWGALMAAFMWIYGLMSPVSGAIADRLNRKNLIVWSLFIWSAVTFLMGYVDTYTELYILRAVMGFSEALYIPAALSLIADIHNGKTRSIAIGIHMTGLYLGQIAGGFGSIFSGLLNWHTVFLVCGLVGMLYSIVLIFFISDPGREKRPAETAEKNINQPSVIKSITLVLSNVAFWAVLFVFTTLSMPGWATKNWLPELLATVIGNNWGIDVGEAMNYAGPIAVISLAGASFIGAMIGGHLSDKWVQKNVRGRVYTSSIGLALIVPSLIFMGLGNDMLSVILAILCFGIGYGFFDTNNMPILCQFIPSRQRATAYGFINMSGVLGGAAITTMLGNLSLGVGFALLGGVTILSLLIQIIALRPKTINIE
ncbi:MAG: MFS transporter [Bacteroidaceae bacterium]|nr:MFS transporter [Bacteroidaceae bacterium]